jgi:hypothetical protein
MLPDSVLLSTPLGRFKNNNLPFTMLVVSTLLAIVRVTRYTVPLMYAVGSYTAWFYLRFYQKHDNGLVGDAEDHFRFSRCETLVPVAHVSYSLFPSALHGCIGRVSTVSHTLAVRARIVPPAIRRFVDMQQLNSANDLLLPVHMPPADAERRRCVRRVHVRVPHAYRQKAMRELNERMERARTAQLADATSQWPAMDDTEMTAKPHTLPAAPAPSTAQPPTGSL